MPFTMSCDCRTISLKTPLCTQLEGDGCVEEILACMLCSFGLSAASRETAVPYHLTTRNDQYVGIQCGFQLLIVFNTSYSTALLDSQF